MRFAHEMGFDKDDTLITADAKEERMKMAPGQHAKTQKSSVQVQVVRKEEVDECR